MQMKIKILGKCGREERKKEVWVKGKRKEKC